MPTKKSKLIPKEEGYVTPSKGRKVTDEEVNAAFKGMSVSFDAHEVTSKIIEFGKILTGVSLYKYQEEAVYAIIYSVITFSGDVKTMLFSRQSGKCFSPNTKIRMADMSVRKIKDINVGDYVLGVGGAPRRVLERHIGNSDMYEVHKRSTYGKTYRVNAEHELVFRERLKSGGYADRVMSVKDYLNEPEWKRKDAYVGYRSAVDFPHKDVFIDPYFLGVWLGDGRCDSQSICTPDTEVIDFIREYVSKLGYEVSIYSQGEIEKVHSYVIKKCVGKQNVLLNYLRKYHLVNNKHIPLEYLHNDRSVRLQVLAGLIDSDGHYSIAKGKENTIEVTFRNRKLARDVQGLALSLGFRCSMQSKKATIKELGYECMVYRLCLYGDLWEIPIKVARKKVVASALRENPLHYGFDVIPVGKGDYVGIQIDGDNLFLLDDFTVVHNSEAMAFIVDTLCTLLPALGKIIPDLEQFSTGFRVGLFAPQSDQVQTTYSRAMTRLSSANAEMVMSDPDIDIHLESAVRLALSNGSYLAGQVASKQSKIESKTYDMVIVEEAQDVDDLIVSKCYSEDTKINMPYGDWITIKDVVERKTEVMTPEGKIRPTDWLNTGMQEVFRIELCNGRHLDVTGLHRNLVFRRNYNGQRPFECLTENLRVGDSLAVRDVIPTFGHYGNYSMGVVLGLLLGDGCFSQGVQFCGLKEVWDFVKPHVESIGCEVNMGSLKGNGIIEGAFVNATNKIQCWLKDLGLYGVTDLYKFIPNLPYSEEFLKGLICGLFETDGSVQVAKKGNIQYTSISKRLVEDISFQLQKFGVHCSISVRDQEGGFDKTTNQLYELHIRDGLSVIRFVDTFRLITKNDLLDRSKKIALSLDTNAGCAKVFDDGNRYVSIKSIRSIGMKQTYCVTVPTKDHWIIANGIVSGNSIEPMISSTAGTLIKVGTTGMYKNHFWYEIQHNRQVDRRILDSRIRNHFEFDYKRIIKDRRELYEKDGRRFHLNYEADILRKKARWGEESQAFKLAYALIWDLESGMLLTDKEFNGIINRKLGLQMPTNTDYVVAGLDIGKAPAETVLTIARVFHLEDQFDKSYKQILAWVALGGMDYEAQHHAILDCIVEFNISAIFADYTGVGKAVVDRLMYACGEYVDITPYTFTSQSKSDMWFNFVSEIQTRHLIVPANKKVRSTTEYMKFEEQMKNCQKYFNGAYMVCEKSEGYFDDFVDSCLSSDTEVLTASGFKGIDELTTDDLVASVNADDFSMSYEKPLRKIVKSYQGDMVHFNGEHFEQLVSPHHRVLYERRASHGTSDSSYFIKTTEYAEHVINRGLNSRFPVSAKIKNKPYPISDAEIKLIGWFIAEGWIGRYKKYPNYYRYSIGQSYRAYPEKCTELSTIFSELGLTPYVYDKKNGMRIWQFHKKDNDLFDNLLDRGCHSMPSYWREFSARQMRVLYNALMDGDGSWKSNTYTTRGKELAYEFSELCHIIGKSCYISKDNILYKGKPYILYRCYVAKGGYKRVQGFELIPYNDRIWCVTVPTGYIIIRYKGKVSVTGNCALMCMAANEEQKVDEEMEVTANPLYGGVTDTINAIKRHSY